ncbi:hypothetical protein TRFO_20161 [Tritrichomonas foetus]|uniref:Mannosyltransferase n=1 Tax=Tritrichomonas foetus TaxID=1144522 RepID=A0A1J4KHJ1_9EUKA|nr:hypothetical protein TRFO_20161 [Tritrichomonas foetus]|eukprot:OHT10498.1 hypothetical protein TRFO_20161 [Tritrichomonas foetus]
MIIPTLACACWCGYEVVTALARNKWDFLLRVFSGIPLGIIYQSFFVLIIQYFIPWGFNLGVIVIISFSIISIILHYFNNRFHPSLRIRMKVIDALSILISMLFVFVRLELIYFEEGRFTRGAAYSDFSFHTELASSFAIGFNTNRTSFLGFETPMSSGSPLAYPILVNYYSAFLYSCCEVTYPIAFRWPTLLIGISFVYIIHSLTLYYTHDSLAAALSLPLWAFSGGLGFLEVFDYGIAPLNSGVNYIHEFHKRKNVFWFQSLTHIFHPQRSATFALPLCYITILSLICGIEKFEWRFFLLAALAVGITPQTQVHAYAALAIFSIALAAITLPLNDQFFKAAFCWTIFGLSANIIALPLCLPYFDRTEKNNDFFNVKPIWHDKRYAEPPFAFFKVWWNALGVFFVISLFCGFATASQHQIKIYFAGLAVFLVASTIMFQPWELDNCKVFQDGWMPIAVGFVAQFFSKVLQKSHSTIINLFMLILFFASIGSGFLSLITYENYRGHIYSQADEQAGKWIAENTPVDAIFYQSKDHVMAPSASYAGRRLFFGYSGWMSSHGLMNATRYSALNSLENGINPETNHNFNVKYVVVDLNEKNTKSFDDAKFYSKVMEIGQYVLYNFIDEPIEIKKVENETERRNRIKEKRKKKPPIYTFNLD